LTIIQVNDQINNDLNYSVTTQVDDRIIDDLNLLIITQIVIELQMILMIHS